MKHIDSDNNCRIPKRQISSLYLKWIGHTDGIQTETITLRNPKYLGTNQTHAPILDLSRLSLFQL